MKPAMEHSPVDSKPHAFDCTICSFRNYCKCKHIYKVHRNKEPNLITKIPGFSKCIGVINERMQFGMMSFHLRLFRVLAFKQPQHRNGVSSGYKLQLQFCFPRHDYTKRISGKTGQQSFVSIILKTKTYINGGISGKILKFLFILYYILLCFLLKPLPFL